MKIEVQHIPSQGAQLSYLKQAREFPVVKALQDQEACLFVTPVTIELNVRREREIVRVDGVLSATVELACSRCLEHFSYDLKRRFTLRFSREIPADVHPGGSGEVELTAEQIGLIFFKEETIELKDAIQEQIVLSLPYKPLCQESCKGLCPQCGADLNQGPCGCPANRTGSPFEVLKQHQWPE